MQSATANYAGALQPFYWDNYRDTAVGRYLFQHEYAFAERFLHAEGEPRRLLDVCCGSGRMSLPLRATGLNVVGVDINPVALAAFRQRSDEIPLVMASGLSLPFADASFDCVIAMQCFEYLEHRRFLFELNRVLRNGGLLVFDALNRHSYKLVKAYVGRALDLPSANLSCREILSATAGSGFNIQAVSGYNWIPFTRESNSGLVRLADQVERKLRLGRYYSISPKILVAATKKCAIQPFWSSCTRPVRVSAAHRASSPGLTLPTPSRQSPTNESPDKE
ncbi:MAG: class I SAM-dependent methyltransferase [Chloroflexia bacterium]